MTKDEALRLALEALSEAHYVVEHRQDVKKREQAITAIKEALAQPEQPKVRTGNCLRVGVCASEGHKIQPQRTWVGLTHEEIESALPGYREIDALDTYYAIEAKLKDKNT
jgi:20S proteasome alpha/beta subunit